MKLARGGLTTVKAERSEAWALLFKMLGDIYPEALEALRGIQDLHRAACTYEWFGEKFLTVSPWPSRVKALLQGEGDEAETALSEAVAGWQEKFQLTGPVAFEQALWLLADWDPAGIPTHPTGRMIEVPEVRLPTLGEAAPQLESRDEFLSRAGDHYDEVAKLLKEQGDWQETAERRRLRTHLRWLAESLRGASTAKIAGGQSDPSTVAKGVKAVANLLGIPAPSAKPGRPKKTR